MFIDTFTTINLLPKSCKADDLTMNTVYGYKLFQNLNELEHDNDMYFHKIIPEIFCQSLNNTCMNHKWQISTLH